MENYFRVDIWVLTSGSNLGINGSFNTAGQNVFPNYHKILKY